MAPEDAVHISAFCVASLFFFKKFLADTYTCSILGLLVPMFWIFDNVSPGLQGQSGFCLICFCEGKCNVHYLRSTSDVTPANPANLLTPSIGADHFPKCISRDGSWLGFEQQSPAQKTWLLFGTSENSKVLLL